MNSYLVVVVWQGSVYKETITANASSNARKVALSRFPGGTIQSISGPL